MHWPDPNFQKWTRLLWHPLSHTILVIEPQLMYVLKAKFMGIMQTTQWQGCHNYCLPESL